MIASRRFQLRFSYSPRRIILSTSRVGLYALRRQSEADIFLLDRCLLLCLDRLALLGDVAALSTFSTLSSFALLTAGAAFAPSTLPRLR
jgi:hypothetical protein